MKNRHRAAEPQDDGVLRIVAGETKSVSKSSKMTLRAVLSSETVDRYGDIIRASAYNTPKNMKNYFEGNPILLWAHGRDCSVPNLPIGSVKNPDFNGTDMNGKRALEGDVHFTDAHQHAVDIWKLYEAEALRAFSVGFRPVTVKQDSDECEGYEFLEVDLLENSAVPIPANPAAMRKAYLDGNVSEEFLYKTFFRMRDDVLVRNSDIFVPTSWKYKESINELAIMAAEIKSGTWKPYERAVAPDVKKDEYICQNCEKKSLVNMAGFPEKEFCGEKYRNVTCEHCQKTTEQCIEMINTLLSLQS